MYQNVDSRIIKKKLSYYTVKLVEHWLIYCSNYPITVHALKLQGIHGESMNVNELIKYSK